MNRIISFNELRVVSINQCLSAATVFVLIAALSLFNRDLAFYADIVYLVGITLFVPVIGWLLLIFITPFQYLFNFDDTNFWRLQILLLCLVSLRFLPYLYRKLRTFSPYSIIIIFLFVLISLHYGPDVSVREKLRVFVFFISLLGVFEVTSRLVSDKSIAKLALTTILLSALVFITASVVFSIFATPSLIHYQTPYFNIEIDAHQIGLRLKGVQNNPNALARFIAPALLLVACLSVFGRRRFVWGGILVFLSFALASTGTKSVLLAILGATGYFLLFRKTTERGHWVSIVALIIGSCVTWYIWLQPLADRHAASAWAEIGSGVSKEEVRQVFPGEEKAVPPLALKEKVMLELRLGHSVEMQKQSNTTTFLKENFDVKRAGQRSKTWEAGFEVARDNILWGIGYGAWPHEMQKQTGYPFISPHNAFLETIGAYGFLGGVLYAAIFVLAVRNYLILRRAQLESWQKIIFYWSFLYTLTVFLFELVDVATVTTTTMNGVWFWIALAMQESLLNASRFSTTGSGSRCVLATCHLSPSRSDIM